MILIVILALFIVVYMSQQNGNVQSTPVPPPPPENSNPPRGGDVATDVIGIGGKIVGIGVSVAGLIAAGGGTAATGATAAAVGGGVAIGGGAGGGSTAAAAAGGGTIGASATSALATTAAVMNGVPAVIGGAFAVFLAVVAVVVIAAVIAGNIMTANRKYESRFRALANPARIFDAMNQQEVLLLKTLADQLGLKYEITEVRDYSLDWKFIGDFNENYVNQGYMPIFKIAPGPSLSLREAAAMRNAGPNPAYAAFEQGAAVLCVANREAWYSYACMANEMSLAMITNNKTKFSPNAMFDLANPDNPLGPLVNDNMYGHFQRRPFVLNGTRNIAWPNVNPDLYAAAKATAKLRAVVECVKLAKFDPVVWLASDAHTYPAYFMARIGFPDQEGQYFKRPYGANLPNQPATSRVYIAKKEAFGVTNDLSLDLWAIKQSLGGIEVL